MCSAVSRRSPNSYASRIGAIDLLRNQSSMKTELPVWRQKLGLNLRPSNNLQCAKIILSTISAESFFSQRVY